MKYIPDISKEPTFSDLQERYKYLVQIPSDINEHLPLLKQISEGVDHITEFGTRTGVSTSAFLVNKPKKLICYDIIRQPRLHEIERLATLENIDFTFNLKDTLKTTIEETDLLFIDTDHCYTQASQELLLHSDKVKKFIIFHDVALSTGNDDDQELGGNGIMKAIQEFIDRNKNWFCLDHRKNNNGLLILERVDNAKEIKKQIDELTENYFKELIKLDVKYFVIIQDKWCNNTLIKARSGQYNVLRFNQNVLDIFAKWFGGFFDQFNRFRLVVEDRLSRIVIIDSDNFRKDK